MLPCFLKCFIYVILFRHSFGYECLKRGNLFVLDADTLIFLTGNLIHFLDIPTKQPTFRRSSNGAGISCITVCFFQISCWQNVWTVTNFWSSSPLKRVPLIFCVCHQIVVSVTKLLCLSPATQVIAQDVVN